jgi:hypothetical protein
MARTIQIDENGDPVFRNGNIQFLTGADAVGQDSLTAMRALKGEMQYAMQDGMPYFDVAFNNFNPLAFEASARKVIGNVTGVVSVTQFAVSLEQNILRYVAIIETIYGTTYING